LDIRTATPDCTANPYLIREGDEAVLIDGGNRDDFSSVMLKILRTGIRPSQICRLIYQHYDPDLCGNLPQMEALIGTKELRIISHKENNVFIQYYSSKTPRLDFRDLGNQFTFATGRKLAFYATPFCHSRAASSRMTSLPKRCFQAISSAATTRSGSCFCTFRRIVTSARMQKPAQRTENAARSTASRSFISGS
jgi:hypothetical protein